MTNSNPVRLRRLFGLIASILAGATIAACNTVEGAGKDIEATGDAIEDTARDAKD